MKPTQRQPYRDAPARRIVQIATSESGTSSESWSIAIMALDDRGDVWRMITFGNEKHTIRQWTKLPPLPKEEG